MENVFLNSDYSAVQRKGDAVMSVTLRILLFAGSIITLIYIQRKIKKATFSIDEASYWIVLLLGLVIMSAFPRLVSVLAMVLGFESGSNFVFLLVIFLLLIKVFSISKRLSMAEDKIKDLTQSEAIEQFKKNRKCE